MSTIFSRKDDNSIAFAVVKAFNQLHDRVVAGSIGGTGATGFSPSGYYHRDVTSAVATGSNYTEPLSYPMVVNPMPTVTGATGAYLAAVNMKSILAVHLADDNAHQITDFTNATGLNALPLPASQVDVTGTSALLNGIKKYFNAHLTATATGCTVIGSSYGPVGPVNVHVINDGVNSNSTATGVGTGTNWTLAGSLASGISAHLLTGPPVGRIKLTLE